MTIELAFYCFPKKGAIEDFREVARRIGKADPEIRARVFSTSTANLGTMLGTLLLRSRAITIEMDRVKLIEPRATRIRHGRIPKEEQLRRLAEAGLPVPRWTEITPDTTLDPKEWGPYVVVKPTRSSKGAFVRIQKTGRVRYKPASEHPADHPIHRGPMIAQQFVYTGEWPTAAKVLTYFARPLAAIRQSGRTELPPLRADDGFADAAGSSIVASAVGATWALCNEEDVVDLARRVHQLWPDHPSMGIDIVRDVRTRQLYVLELNPGGDSWFLTGAGGASLKAAGIDIYAQFGAIDAMTETSIAVARRFAARAS